MRRGVLVLTVGALLLARTASVAHAATRYGTIGDDLMYDTNGADQMHVLDVSDLTYYLEVSDRIDCG